MVFGNSSALEITAGFWQWLFMRKVVSKLPPVLSHQWLDMANLAMCRAIATKIRRNPKLMRVPRANLRRWKKNGHWPACFREWQRILDRNPVESVLTILTQDNDEGQRLRQGDPFVGILTESERLAFLGLDEKVAA